MENNISQISGSASDQKSIFREKSTLGKIIIIGFASIVGLGIFLFCLAIILSVQIGPPERPNHPNLPIVEADTYDLESVLLMIELLCHNGDYFACLDTGTIYQSGSYNGTKFDPNLVKSYWGYQRACEIELLDLKNTENKKEGCAALKQIDDTQETQ